MSYILEALKKAQAERARGAVPGVDAQPVPTISSRAPVSLRAWAITVFVLLAFCAALYWQGPWSRSDSVAPKVVARVPEAVVPPMPPKAAAASEPASPSAPVPAAATLPAQAVAPSPVPAPPAAPAKPLRKLGERPPGDASAAATPPVPAPERIALLQDLPAQIQREIPTLAINGYIYASNPADRSVLINNRLRREGDTLAEGFVLEKLLPREMVLNYRGYRYRVSY